MLKLDMWSIVKQAYRTAFTPKLWRGAMAWAITLLIFNIGGNLVRLKLKILAAAADHSGQVTFSLASFGWSIICFAGLLALYAAIAVNVHRSVLLDEAPQVMRFSRYERRYFWRSLAAYLRFIGASIVLGIGLTLVGVLLGLLVEQLAWLLTAVLALIVFVLLFVYLSPYALVLPGPAIGARELTFAEALRTGESHRWRIFLTLVGIALPMTLVSLALSTCLSQAFGVRGTFLHRFAAIQENFELSALVATFSLPLQVLLIVTQAAGISYIYRDLVQRQK